MSDEVTMNARGVVTLPAALRRQFGLNGDTRLIVEARPEGFWLRPAVSVPVEMYTDERIAEFEEDEAEIEAALSTLERNPA